LYICQNNICGTKITFMSKLRGILQLSLSLILPHFYTLPIESTLTVLKSHWRTLTDFAQEREMLSTLTKTALAATTALIVGLAPIATADLALAHGRGGGGSHLGGGGGHFGGGFHGGGFQGGSGFRGRGGGFHGAGVSALHRGGGRARGFFGGYGYGYNCGFGFDCGVYDSGFGNGYAGGGAGNAVSSSGGYSGGYVPDPVGADIPPLIIPTNCWVRRAAYDPSGAHGGQVLIDLCRPSDSVTVTGLKAQSKTPGLGTGQPAIDQKTP
jgi:hypothetical protein